jgi:hypothetical protein
VLEACRGKLCCFFSDNKRPHIVNSCRMNEGWELSKVCYICQQLQEEETEVVVVVAAVAVCISLHVCKI